MSWPAKSAAGRPMASRMRSCPISNALEYCGLPRPKCFPIGSWPGKTCFAKVWFTITTCREAAVSCAVKLRPRTIGTPGPSFHIFLARRAQRYHFA